MVIKLVVTHACEIQIMKKQTEQKLVILKGKYCLNKPADGTWRLQTNEELKKKTTMTQIKTRRIAWLGDLESIEEHRPIMKITERKHSI
jgi:hypothetical protein